MVGSEAKIVLKTFAFAVVFLIFLAALTVVFDAFGMLTGYFGGFALLAAWQIKKARENVPALAIPTAASNKNALSEIQQVHASEVAAPENAITFIYTNADGDTSTRKVRVDEVDGRYINGFCYTAKDTRTFRHDRIVGKIEENGFSYTVDEWLAKHGIKKESAPVVKHDKVRNLEICFTGFPKAQREDFESLAWGLGFTVRKNITQNLDYLVGGKNAGPSKIAQAQAIGAIVMDEEEFIEMINSGEVPL